MTRAGITSNVTASDMTGSGTTGSGPTSGVWAEWLRYNQQRNDRRQNDQ